MAHVRSPRAQDPLLAVAAMSSVIDAYEEVCRSLGLEPGLVELSGLALCRSAFGRGAPGDRLLVNWDDGYATLVLVREGWPVLVRTLTGAMVSSPDEVAREASADAGVCARAAREHRPGAGPGALGRLFRRRRPPPCWRRRWAWRPR